MKLEGVDTISIGVMVDGEFKELFKPVKYHSVEIDYGINHFSGRDIVHNSAVLYKYFKRVTLPKRINVPIWSERP